MSLSWYLLRSPSGNNTDHPRSTKSSLYTFIAGRPAIQFSTVRVVHRCLMPSSQRSNPSGEKPVKSSMAPLAMETANEWCDIILYSSHGKPRLLAMLFLTLICFGSSNTDCQFRVALIPSGNVTRSWPLSVPTPPGITSEPGPMSLPWAGFQYQRHGTHARLLAVWLV